MLHTQEPYYSGDKGLMTWAFRQSGSHRKWNIKTRL